MEGLPWLNDGELIATDICVAINELIRDTLQASGVQFTWTSLQVNHNTVASWHQDSGNLGTSAILIGGDFDGGEFELESLPAMDLRNHLTFFNGQAWHRSLPFEGHRVSIVAFTHALTPKCPQQICGALARLGFSFPHSLA